DLKKQREAQLKDQPLVDQLNNNMPLDEFLWKQGMSFVGFREFLKRNGQAITTLNFSDKRYRSDYGDEDRPRGFFENFVDYIPEFIESCPYLTHVISYDQWSANKIISSIKKGKLTKLESLDFS